MIQYLNELKKSSSEWIPSPKIEIIPVIFILYKDEFFIL